MSATHSQHDLLLRHIDGRLTPEERLRVDDLLRSGPDARAFLREVAEQAVMVADLERLSLGRPDEPQSSARRSDDQRRNAPPNRFRGWRWGLSAAAAVGLVALVGLQLRAATRPRIAGVSKVTGSSHYFGSNGKIENALTTGAYLGVGDTLETRSCDASIELEMSGGSTITVASHSTLRLLAAQAEEKRFELLQGNLWVSPARQPVGQRIAIQTPTAIVEARDAQFDLQTSASETILRVNRGAARLTRIFDGRVGEVPAEHQVAVSLGRHDALAVVAQPKPVNHWTCDLGQAPKAILGTWLPPTEHERTRLGAEPLLWPIAEGKSVMLYAVALAASTSSPRPVLLRPDSRLRVRGRTERRQMVRFGFSVQRMRGVFAGKFEADVPPASLAPAGETWEVELPLGDFRPLHPQLAASPDKLELTDVYALTIEQDAGLEINHIELLPGNGP